jgi:short-subunit dehydrogenase
MSTIKPKGIALITGASTGIGAIYADRLAKRGFDLILVARKQARLDALAKRLKTETGRSVETIAADLNDKADLAKVETTLRGNAGITLLVNNAGVGAAGPLLNSFSQSLQHELTDKGVRVQAVLPGATATEFWDIAGLPVQHLPTEIVMSAENMVDAALAGFDQGETVTIPSLPEKSEWDGFDAARRAMSGRLSSAVPASRYNVSRSQTAAT